LHGLRRKVDLFITWFLWLSWQGEWKLLCSQVWSSFFPLRAWYWFKKLFSLYIENYFGIKYGSEWKGGSDSEYQNFLQAWLILKHSYNKLCCLIRNKSYNHFSIKYFILLLICIASKVIYINEKFNSHDVYGAP